MSSSDNDNMRLGAFVTNKWLVATLVTLVMMMGGYIFRGVDRWSEAQAQQIDVLQRRVQGAEIDLASLKVTLALQNNEIIRRLDRIEQQLYVARRSAP